MNNVLSRMLIIYAKFPTIEFKLTIKINSNVYVIGALTFALTLHSRLSVVVFCTCVVILIFIARRHSIQSNYNISNIASQFMALNMLRFPNFICTGDSPVTIFIPHNWIVTSSLYYYVICATKSYLQWR